MADLSLAPDEYEWHTGLVRPHGMPDAVEFIDVHKAFGRNKILRGLNMGLPEGKISMILGPSGTGKSVCIKHMVGLLYPDQGDVLVHGESVPNMPDDDLLEMRKKFGVLFQDGALFGSMNVFDNVAFPLRQHTDKAEEEIVATVTSRLDEVGLGFAGDKFPNELSGGMRKRAGFARALVLDPDIVLFDEPDSGLDPVRTALLGELIQEIHEEVMEQRQANGGPLPAFTLITHDIMTARRVAEHISVLWKGRTVASSDDISTPAGGEAVINAATETFGRIDIVVNNAGVFSTPRPLVETSLETFERLWRVHFGGTYNVTRAAWPHFLRQQYGRVVNTGSSAGLYGLHGLNEYSAAKGAVHAFTYSLAFEGAEHGILVNAIGPVGVTRMSQELFADPSVVTDDVAVADGIQTYFRSDLCSPAVVWLAHEDCDSNGKIYQAHAGRVACVATGEPNGYWDANLTPESVRDHVDEITSREDVLFPRDAVTWAGWALTNSAKHHRA